MFFEEAYIAIASCLLFLASILINKTIRLKVIGEERLNKIHKSGSNIIFAFWHQATFPLFPYYRNRRICIIPVNTVAGRVLARFAKRYGYKASMYPVAGSPIERTKSISDMVKILKSGYDGALAVDGPPNEELYKAKPGVLYLAQKTGYPIIPAGVYMKTAIRLLWRWDKYLIPLPFSSVVIYFDEPYNAPKNIDVFRDQNLCRDLEDRIHKATKLARASLH